MHPTEGSKPKRTPRKPKLEPVKGFAIRDGRPVLPYSPKINRWTGLPHENRREIARHGK